MMSPDSHIGLINWRYIHILIMFLTSYKILLIKWFVIADPPNVLYEEAI